MYRPVSNTGRHGLPQFKQELPTMLDEDEKVLLADFIGENWQLFVDRAAESGYSEAEAEYIYAKLDRGV